MPDELRSDGSLRNSAQRPILILGGTPEARHLALALEGLRAGAVWYSLAGRADPVGPMPKRTRIGGFGGSAGLRAALREMRIAALIDATHPFADQMPHQAVEACAAEHIPRLRLLRPPWQRHPQDDWCEVLDLTQAATALNRFTGRSVFSALGSQGSKTLQTLCPGITVHARVLSEQVSVTPCQRIVQAPPYRCDAETDLFRRLDIAAIISKNAGGEGAYAKIAAARASGLPVIMLQPPDPPPGPVVGSTADAMTWLRDYGLIS